MQRVYQDLAKGQPPASLRAVHPHGHVRGTLEDDIITNCHCRPGMAKSTAVKNAVLYYPSD